MTTTERPTVATRPRPLPAGYQSVIVGSSALAEDARGLEYEIFVDEGFFPASSDGRIKDYADFEDRSIFHVIVDDGGRPAGVVRSVIGDYDSLPVGKYVPDRWSDFPDQPVVEYASLAIRPECRKLGLAEELYRSVFALAWRSDLLGLVALVDPWMHELLNDFYGCAFEQIGPDCHHFHGFTVRPIGMSLQALEAAMPYRAPEFWRWLVEGIEGEDVIIDLRDPNPDPVIDLRDPVREPLTPHP